MNTYKKIVPCLTWDWDQDAGMQQEILISWEDNGADEVMVRFPLDEDVDTDEIVAALRPAARVLDIPLLLEAPVYRLEDVKKFLYVGASCVVFDPEDIVSMEVYPSACERFGADRCLVWAAEREELPTAAGTYVSAAFAETPEASLAGLRTEAAGFLLRMDQTPYEALDLPAFKRACRNAGIPVNTFESAVSWSDFKLNEAGLIPVIVQDYKTDEVLMMAYMNEEAFCRTCEDGRMTYFSRSRQSLWLKGETSGHYQYVKSLTLDCDNDTILAKVKQIGAACHTGSRSCFFQPLAAKEYTDANPLQVLEHVYSVIEDRKANPKEGSYTNYLFDKGIDKILKKVGEEATEIVIAAKNPDPEEIKYEISDFLYHAMVLMVERGVTWSDITKELANRE